MTPDIVNTLCREALGTAPESLSRVGTGMVNTVYIMTVNGGKYVLRMNSEKGSYREMYCADLMSERGMTFNGRKVEVSKDVIDRFNRIYDAFTERWNERKKKL